MITSDILFSYWILIWYILYKIKIIPFNPIYAFVIAVIFMTIIIFYLLIRYDNTCDNYKNIILFIIVNFFLKVLPTIDMYNNSYGMYDFIFGLILFGIYNIYIYSKGRSFSNIYLNIDSIEEIRDGRLLIMRTIKKTFGI